MDTSFLVRKRSRIRLGGLLLDLDDLAGASASGLAGRGLLAATLGSEDSGSSDDGSYNGEMRREEGFVSIP